MTLQTIPGSGMWIPELPDITVAAQTFNSLLMDATAEKVAFMGHVFNKDRASKNITKVGILPGTVTLNASSTIKISIQAMNQAASASAPTGTILGATNNGFVTEASATYTTNTWHQTAALGEVVPVTFGQEIAVVIEYGTFTAADVFNVRGLTLQQAANFPIASLFTASWSNQATMPNVILEFDDGTFGTLDGTFPISAIYASPSFHSGSTPDEYAMEFQLPFPFKIDAFALDMVASSATADFKVIMYDGTSVMSNGSVTFDGAVIGTSTQRMVRGAFTGMITGAANTTYRLALQPQSGSQTISFAGYDVNAAGHFQAHQIGTTCCMTTRTDAGAWAAATTTRRPLFFFRVCALDDGAGSGGGMMVHPGLSGGARG